MSKSNTKSKTAYEEKTGLFVCAYSCVQNQLDTADFLIDGLTSRRASGAGTNLQAGFAVASKLDAGLLARERWKACPRRSFLAP
jgi:hypothetical protein